MKGMFSLDANNVRSALVYGVLTALMLMAVYVVGIGDIFKIDYRSLLNIGVISLLTTFVSLVKNLLTNSKGKFAGVVKVIPPIK